MPPEIAIRVSNLSKCYQIYDTPRDRLKQFVMPRLPDWAGRGIYTFVATVIAWAGYAWFQKTRKGFADVL